MTETAESNLHNDFYTAQTVESETSNGLDSMAMISVDNIENDASNQVDGIEILVSMAKNGKIDPWNVDIVDVTDKYLSHLFQMKAQNLRLTGRTLLFAAILLRLKSNVLEGIDANQIEGIEPEQDEFDYNDDDWTDEEESFSTNNVISIDEALQRRTS